MAVVKQLLVPGEADVNYKDNFGQTPLSSAAEGGHEAVVKLLLKTGMANVHSKDNNDWTPLSWATAGSHEAVVELLLNAGAEVDCVYKVRVSKPDPTSSISL